MKTAGRNSSTKGGGLAWLPCLVVLAALSAQAFAQTLPPRWRWSNPTPHGGNVFDMAYGLGVTIQVAERGQIYTSDDLFYWQPRESGTTNALRAVTFQGNRAIITGEAGTVLYADSLDAFQLVNLNTPNWLEGVTATANKVVTVGDNAAIYVSSDSGATWQLQTINGATNWLHGVANDGNSFVAVGDGGFIATATANATTWTKQTSGTTSNLNRVAYLNGKFWIVGDGGIALTNTSANLKNWASVASGATNSLYSATGTNTAAALLVGDKEVRLTTDGSTWASQTDTAKTMPAAPWTYYSGLWEGSLYLIAGRSGMMYEGFSTNGTDTLWVRRHDPVRTWLWDVMRTPNFYVAVGDYATILTSERGVDWELEAVPDAATNSIFLGVGGTTNGLVVVGSQGMILFSPNQITNVVLTNQNLSTVTNSVSTVGTIWNAVPRPVTNDLQGVALLNNLFVVSGGGGTILTSTDGTNWTKRSTPVNAFLSSVEAFPGGLVATGDAGAILTSSDGSSWTQQTSGTTNWIYRVRYLNGQLIAVGENGTILTSASGLVWIKQNSGTTRWLTDAEFTASTWFVSGAQGAVLASADSLTWTNVGTITQKSLYGLASNNGQLLAVGVEGAILRSQLTPINDPFKFINFGSAAGTNLFSVSGQVDQRIAFDSGTNLVDWVEGITLEILDPSGSLLFMQNADTNAPPWEFFRGRSVQ